MAEGGNERIAYYNGEYLPESQVRIPFRDRGFLLGDGVFDMTRTFAGRIFRIREHIERLFRSMKAVRIEPGLSVDEFVDISEEVLRRNSHFLDRSTDYWVAQRVSRGVAAVGDEGWDQDGPTIIVECLPLPLEARAPYYRDGVDVVVDQPLGGEMSEEPPDPVHHRVLTLGARGLSSVEIARETGVKPGEVELILALHAGGPGGGG